MRKKKLTKKKSGTKKLASRKKMIRREKPLPPMKAKRSKGPSRGPSAQIHQGVGAAPAPDGAPTNDLLESDLSSEHGRG